MSAFPVLEKGMRLMRRLQLVRLGEVVAVCCLGVLAWACSSTAVKNTPANDSGAAGSDSGAAGSDSGAAGSDSGAAGSDSGAAGSDSGAAGSDSGAAGSDSGAAGGADASADALGGCGGAGATPVPETCGTPAGACATNVATGGHSAEIVCTEFGGIWTSIPAQAAGQCTGSNTWYAGKTCAQVVSGIQAGCETKTQAGFCNVEWYGPGCLTALGSSCEAHPTHDTWVSP